MDESYDVIVVGAGLGGLSCAASLAKAGKRVLLVERQDGVGGFAHAFRRGPYIFDPAVHFTVLGQRGEFLHMMLSILGVEDQVEFLEMDLFAGVEFPDGRFDIPVGLDAAIDAMGACAPEAANSIRAFFEVAAEFTEQSMAQGPRVPLKDLEATEGQYPLLFKYRMSTLDEVLDEFVSDPKARAMCGIAWPYVGTPPARVSFATYSANMVAVMSKGPVSCKGGFQSLADAFASAIRLHGGDITLSSPVTKILVEDGRAAGVEIEGGRRVRADVVVSNADASCTFEQLVGEEHLPEAFMRRLRRMKPAPSAVALYAATRADPAAAGLPHEMLINHHWDHAKSWTDVTEGRLGGLWVAFPTIMDPSLAPEGEHLVILTSLAQYDIGEPWAEAKPRFTEMLMDEAERILPGFREGLTHAEVATPLTLERYTGVQRGAIYGWDNTPAQSVPKRLSQQTPLPGLYLAGHWANPGSGSFRSTYSGIGAAGIVLGHPTILDFIGALAGFPPEDPA